MHEHNYNAQGFCICNTGRRKPFDVRSGVLAYLGHWPRGTWFQQRRLIIAVEQASQIDRTKGTSK